MMTSFQSTSRLAGRNRRRAFTIIELLVVIGIILILIGLFFGGAKVVTAQAKERDTKQMLETCKTMFENYRQGTKLARYPAGLLAFGPSASPPSTWYTGEESAIGAVTSDALSLSNNGPMPTAASPILNDTVLVYSAIESISQNQTIIANLPPDKKINIHLSTGATVSIPLDGWGNPIFFVPGGGLGTTTQGPGAVWIDGTQIGIVTSTSVISGPPLTVYLPYAAGNIVSTQPFFVSAGPDGDLSNAHGWTTGNPVSSMTDDNIYSFQ